jgi:hypothetical protein
MKDIVTGSVNRIALLIVRLILASMLLAPGLAAAADERVARILKHDGNVAAFDRLREDFLPITTTEFGFTPEAVEFWRSAVNQAFDADILQQEYTELLTKSLPLEAIDTILDFNDSDLRQHRDRISDQLLAMQLDDPEQRAALQAEVASLPAELVDTAMGLFEQYGTPDVAEALVEGYLQAMYLAAEPYVGADNANAWMEEHRQIGLSETYGENTFLIFAAILGQFPPHSRGAYIAAISTPEYIAYEQAAALAMKTTYNAAIERLQLGLQLLQ